MSFYMQLDIVIEIEVTFFFSRLTIFTKVQKERFWGIVLIF